MPSSSKPSGDRVPTSAAGATTPLKVSYVTIQFPAQSETFASNEVRTLSQHGVDVSVHALRRAGPHTRRLLEERGVAHLRVTHNDVWASLRGLLHALARPRLLVRACTRIVRLNRHDRRDLLLSLLLLPRAFDVLADVERNAPDVVHMYWGHYPTLVGDLVQARLPNVVTSVSIVAYDLVREYAGTVSVARAADVVRTHAQVNTAHVARFTGRDRERIDVIYNGVDIAWVERIREAHAKVPRRIVTTGRLIEEKGMDDVITAFAAIRRSWPTTTLVILGDGPDRERLERLAASLEVGDAVTFLGHVAHERVVEEMAQAEVFLLLSRYVGERLPNVVKEGMASRCVCVTTPSPGIEELVEHRVTGFVVPVSDPGPAADVVDEVFSGRVQVERLLDAASAHVAQHFDLARTAPRYGELWRAALARRAAASERAPRTHGV